MAEQPVSFEWKGRKVLIPRPKVKQVLAFYDAQDALTQATADNNDAAALRAVVAMLETLECPKDIVESCDVAELGELVQVVTRAIWPEAEAGNG